MFRETMHRVLPNQPIVDIARTDSVMHVLYDIEEKDLTFIPGTRHLRMGAGGKVIVRQPEGTAPARRALSDAPEYPAAMTTLAYRYGINYLIYSITH